MASDSRRRPAEEIPLAERYAEGLQRGALGFGFDAFGDDPGVGLGGKVCEGGGECAAGRLVIDGAGQGHVELDEVRVQTDDMLKAGETGAGIVDSQQNALLAHGRNADSSAT